MKTFYLFDENTFEFKGIYEAQESPLEEGVYISPIYSNDIEPLDVTEGKYNYLNGTAWELKDDTRGTWFKPNREQVEIESLLAAIDSTWSRVKPELPPLTPKEQVNKSILELESSITERRLREAILGIDGGWLSNVNAQIATLRAVQ